MRISLPAAALGAAFLWVSPIKAQAPCMAHETLTAYLAERFAEQPRGLGLITDQRVMELFVSAEGTWSVVLTDRHGIACLVMAGEGWDQVPAPPAPEF